MRCYLLASTCCVALASAATAETTITTKQTAPVRTSTIKSGAPDDIKITSAGSLELTTAGPAITVDSANKVTNEGTIQIANTDDARGIVALAGTSGGIVNTGKIVLDESYAPTDGDNDGDIDGPFAVGKNRIGIHVGGAYTGDIASDFGGSIAIEGNDSFGIRLDGPLNGKLTHNGSTTVLGDRAVGIQAGAINGSVRLAGTVATVGLGAVGARFDGPIDGTLTIQGAITSTGYRYTTPPADTSKLDADDLLQGGSAVIVADNVAGGIILAVPPKDNSTTDNDEDKDGIEDSKEGSAAVRSYGAAPAMRIGSATKDIAIGAVPATGTGYGLIIDGTIAGSGLYKDVTGTGLSVGGLGGSVTIAGGIGVSGTVSASSVNTSATAIHLGAGASTPLIHVTGTVSVSGSSAANTVAGGIVVDAGASLPTIRNAGSIKAATTGEDGTAVAIWDRSGTVGLVENAGTIAATGAKADSGRNVAIDLSANNSGATIRQTQVAAGITAPSITGNIHFGGGNDVLDVADGTVTGNTSFGTGADTLRLSGDAIYKGDVDFGTGGATMTLTGTAQFQGKADFRGEASTLGIATGSIFSGSLANAGALALTVNGGALDLTAPAAIGSLAVSDKGILAVTLSDAGNTTPILDVAGTASFAADSRLVLRVTDVENAEGNHLVLRAGTLTGASNITADTALVPWLYKASLSSTANALNVALARKSTTELGLNRSEAAAFDAIYAALGKDAKVEGTFLSIMNEETFGLQMQQMLPDHAGGIFSAVTQGSRLFAGMLQDPTGPFKDEGKWGYWINQVAWGVEKDRGDTSAFENSGWGIGGGGEIKTGLGSFGGSLAYLWSRNRGTETANQTNAKQFELAAYWRLKSGGLRATARGSMSFIDLDGSRAFEGMNGTEKVSLTANSDRGARLYSGFGSLSYDWVSTGGISFRPVVALDYYRLHEKAYTETGGGDAYNLAVRSRTSDELAVTGSAVVGLDMGGADQWSGWSRFELEAGRREIVSGNLGKTVARFASGGEEFTLLPDDRESGWIGRLRGLAGNSAFQIGGELGAEQHQGNWALSLRASLRVGL
ncbi:YapH-family protein [Sphingobium sp. SYK-6]|uniref:autotransporter outer membrane beta-barrel domain-containing protein n=1 Tax=Sphingobium sp. (strain NBRC 103272 / SYK-6) TaxID=627192 RepID=UPI00022766B7|nr:autotransporter outer membrane beta-barrel domain-containing protein [Sphingobium sp. SYK-6]BAK65118.1 YapH-family protein [Sphingobium sp. SYK-6]